MEKKEEFHMPLWVYVILVVLVIFLVTRYGWKVFGNSQCSTSVGIEEVLVEDGQVTVKAFQGSGFSLGGFVGAVASQEGATLYVGVKYNTILGWLPWDPQTATYSFATQGRVNRVVLQGSGNDKVIYDESNDEKVTVNVKIQNILIEELDYTCYLGENPVVTGGIAVENQNSFLIPFEFHKSQFPEGAEIEGLGLKFTLKGSEGEVDVEGPIRPGISWGESATIWIESVGDQVSVTVN